MSVIQFWNGQSSDIDLQKLSTSSIPVKGAVYENPIRFLEIYGNISTKDAELLTLPSMDLPPSHELARIFLPQVPGIDIPFGQGIYQPPFNWDDCSPDALAVNFTYTTNAFFRILKNLSDQNMIDSGKIDTFLDQACVYLSAIYKSNDYEIIRFINNNINMFLISKVIETIVGKDIYNAECQELSSTMGSLTYSLNHLDDHIGLPVKQIMGLAVGKGVAFIEQQLSTGIITPGKSGTISDANFRYFEKPMAIDDRDHLIERIAKADAEDRPITMCAILDDTAETVDDLLWMQELMIEMPRFSVNLLVNTAQVSINFSTQMLQAVFRSRHFKKLVSLIDRQLTITHMYCPLISFQPSYFEEKTKQAVASADFLYIKGLNFFETCQIPNKDRYHAFVVFGPISRMYTGLKDYDGVFAFLPAGVEGYMHHRDPEKIRTLSTMHQKTVTLFRN